MASRVSTPQRNRVSGLWIEKAHLKATCLLLLGKGKPGEGGWSLQGQWGSMPPKHQNTEKEDKVDPAAMGGTRENYVPSALDN